MNLLIIEDSKTVAEYLASIFQKENHITTIADTGEQALTLLSSNSFQTVLLDLNLPDIEGKEILKNIRLDKLPNELPVIVISGLHDEHTIAEILKLGANDFITKPFNETALKLKLKNLLEIQSVTAQLKQSNAQCRDIFNYSPVASLVLDESGVIEEMNKMAYTLFDTEPGANINVLCGEILACKNTVKNKGMCGKMEVCSGCIIHSTLNETLSIKTNLIKREGKFNILKNNVIKERIFLVSTIHIQFYDKPKSVLTIEDVTEQRQAELALSDSEAKFKTISTSAHDAIIMIDDKDNVTFWNPAAEKMFGFEASEIFNKRLHQLIVPERYLPVYEQAFAHYKKTGEGRAIGQTVELTAKHKNNTEFPVEISLSKSHMNGKWSAIGIVRDITAKKQYEHTLKQREKELSELNATKDKFVSIIAHDLKNPFSTIIGFADLLIDNVHKYEKDKIKFFAKNIRDTARQTFNLLENLLEWSRCQQNKVPFAPQKTRLYDLAYESYMLVKSTATAKEIAMNLNVPQNIELTVDREMLNTVFRNLLTNAIKFTAPKGKIDILAQVKDHSIEIKIIDTGIGMDEKTIASLFKVGETKSLAGTNGEHGTGLGLILCKEFVEKHNGTINIVSAPNKGSEFIITVPSLEF